MKRFIIAIVALLSIGFLAPAVVTADEPPIPASWDGGACPDGIKATITRTPSGYITTGLGNQLLSEPLNFQVVQYEPGVDVHEIHGTTYASVTKIVAVYVKYVGQPGEGQYLESVGQSIDGGVLAIAAPDFGPVIRRVSVCVKFGAANPPS